MIIGVFSLISVPVTFSVNLETFASHVPNHTNCTNWEGRLDTDCDGIADWWENLGYYEKNGKQVDLPPGVHFKHRDFLLEMDYMGHHQPTVTALNAVVAKFNAMDGLQNPDGTTGVRLHYKINDNIPHKTCINIWSDTDTDQTNDFSSIKKNWMGNSTERSSNSNFYQVAKDVYHYFLFIHTQCGSTQQQQSAGAAEGPGNDGVVSLGYDGWGNEINGHDTGSNDYKARSLTHELGHNLGLKHAGSADYPHCKPNYISVMNYLFEFPVKVPSAASNFDFSKNLIPELNENALLEWTGIGPSWPNGLPTGVGHSSFTHNVPPNHVLETTANNIGINYNWYRGSGDTDDTVSSSITNFNFAPCNDDDVTNSGYGNRLWGFNDIHYSSLTFWALSGATQNGTGVSIPPVNVSNATLNSTFLPSSETASSIVTSGNSNTLPSSETASSIVTSGNSNTLPSSETASSIVTSGNSNTLPSSETASSIVTSGNSNTLPETASSIVTSGNSETSHPQVIQYNEPPCKVKDPHCDLNRTAFFVQGLNEDWGNRTIPQELTVREVLQALSSNAIDINSHIQAHDPNNFTEWTNATQLKRDLQNSLVDRPDSLYNLIKSSRNNQATDQAMMKLSDLRQLIDGADTSKQILQVRDENLVNLIDGLSILLEKRR